MLPAKMFGMTAAAAVLLAASMLPSPARSEDSVEKAGVAIAVSAGNMWFVPLKAISTSMGLLSGALSFVLTGNDDLTQQIWRDALQGPYIITPELAEKAIGERPELLEKQ
jgi:ABC-type sugar transport system substrate-binding protein